MNDQATYAHPQPRAVRILTPALNCYEQLTRLQIPEDIDNEPGNCFSASLWVAHGIVQRWPQWAEGLRLVHAEVCGNGGALEGVHFAHAYATLTIPGLGYRLPLALDFSKRQRIIIPLEYYEQEGRINEIGNRHEYTYREAIDWSLRSRHYGPWELATSSGL